MASKFPNWLKKGARISVKSAIFGLVTATVTDVSDWTFSYKPERRGTDYSCSVTYPNMMQMICDGLIRPL